LPLVAGNLKRRASSACAPVAAAANNRVNNNRFIFYSFGFLYSGASYKKMLTLLQCGNVLSQNDALV
jgi:hypothetical protein